MFASLLLSCVCTLTTQTPAAAEIVTLHKIWDQAPHNAFTDLIRFKGRWYCTFREGDGHVPGVDGTIRVLVSDDAKDWSSDVLLVEGKIDLRDPKLSVTADGRLMVVAGGSVYESVQGSKKKKLTGRRPRVFFRDQHGKWSKPMPVLEEGEWLWRVTWHKGKAYGVSYNASKRNTDDDRSLHLQVSTDGLHFEERAFLDVPGFANETTVRFLDDDTMLALVRRENGSRNAWIGSSKPPYKQWSWHETDRRIGGPNFIKLEDGTLLAAGRSYPGGAKTVLSRLDLVEGKQPPHYQFSPLLTLPSGGDNSYPGMVFHDGHLWMTYYSSHEGRTSIYLAKIKLK